jgi:uncharacterized protein DUF2442
MDDPSALVRAHYDAVRDVVGLTFRGGGSMVIPRRMVPGLQKAPTSALESIEVSPAGDALSWRTLDVDVYVPGLVERAFGARLFARATGNAEVVVVLKRKLQLREQTVRRAADRGNEWSRNFF